MPLFHTDNTFSTLNPENFASSQVAPLNIVRGKIYVRITLIVSIETYKEVNSTSFNLKQEVFIRRDED